MTCLAAILLFPETPKMFLDVFADYVRYWNDVPCIFSESQPLANSLITLKAIPKDDSDSLGSWEISIPLGCVLAIVDMQEGKHPVGFLPL